jgi:hypothetical protein
MHVHNPIILVLILSSPPFFVVCMLWYVPTLAYLWYLVCESVDLYGTRDRYRVERYRVKEHLILRNTIQSIPRKWGHLVSGDFQKKIKNLLTQPLAL